MNFNFLNNNKAYRILLHVLFWVSYIVIYCLLTDLTYRKGFFFTLYDTLMFIPVDIATAYFTMYFIMPRFLYKRKYFQFFIYFTFTCIVAIFITQVTHYFIYLPVLHPEYAFKRGFFEYNYFYFLVSTCSITIFAAAIKLTKNWFNEQNLKAQLEKQNLKSELALLRSQINPHFLFNTLNNIDSLIQLNPDKASNAIIKLSDILRYMLYEANTEKVSLEKEVQYLNGLIQLHSLRFQNPNFISLSVSGNLNNIYISPMLIVPFVENAIKHGNKNVPSPGVIIKIIASDNQVDFCIENYLNSTNVNKDNTGGIGLLNVKRRLELLYEGKHKLEIKEEKNKYIVLLTLKSNEN